MENRVGKFAALSLLLLIMPMTITAQNDGVRPLVSSAMDYLFQPPIPWSGGSFADPKPTQLERFYIGAGVGVDGSWSYQNGVNESSAVIQSKLFAGYKLAPVHSLELSTGWGNGLDGGAKYNSVGLSYLFNLTSFASRLESSRRWDLQYVGGVEADISSGMSARVNSGLRAKYNIRPSFGVYVEPGFSVVGYSGSGAMSQVGDFNSSVTFGVTFSPSCIVDYLARRREYWSSVDYELQPLFAVKSNLLYDAATVLNFEIEVPIGERFSVAGEWIFPWWCNDDGTKGSERRRTQLLNGTLEGRYWLGKRSRYQRLCGWFGGVYMGFGLYDFEREAVGYQGESCVNVGVSGGFSHLLNRVGSLRMEYSLGFGYFSSDYQYYEATYGSDKAWHPIILEEGRFKWFGLTRAKVSLVWMITRKRSY